MTAHAIVGALVDIALGIWLLSNVWVDSPRWISVSMGALLVGVGFVSIAVAVLP